MNYFTEEGKFLSTPEKGEVSSLLLLPENPIACVVLGHGAGAGMRHANMENIAIQLANKGIATFRYQFPYMERGGGRDSVAVSLATVRAAVKAAQDRVGEIPLFAAGHSFGGRMTSLAAAEEGGLPGVSGLIFFAFPLHAPGKPGTDRAAHLPQITVPMLFLSGTRDTFAQLPLFQPMIENLGKKAHLHLLETASHGYKVLKRTRTNPEDIFEEMGRVAHEWIENQLSH